MVITETVPANTTFYAVLSNPAWSCDGTGPGSTCTLAVGNLAAGAGGAAGFTVIVAGTLPAGVSTIRNVAAIGDDGLNGPDLQYGDNQASQDTNLGTPSAVAWTGAAVGSESPPFVHMLTLLTLVLASCWLLRSRTREARRP